MSWHRGCKVSKQVGGIWLGQRRKVLGQGVRRHPVGSLEICKRVRDLSHRSGR